MPLPFSTTQVGGLFLLPASFRGRKPVLDKLLALDRLRDLRDRLSTESDGCVFERILRLLQVSYQLDERELALVPPKGPVLVVANHPFGMLEGILLGAILSKVRPDVKILANHLLSEVVELNSRLIAINPFEASAGRVRMNARGLRQAVGWLKSGGMLLTFPAGEVSRWDMRAGALQDRPWSPKMARLARITEAKVVPVFLNGSNSMPFYMLGMVHPLLRTARLPMELLNKAGKRIEVRVGTPISSGLAATAGSDAEAIGYMRGRTYLLSQRMASRRSGERAKCRESALVDLPATLRLELESLPSTQLLEENQEYSVWVTRAAQAPAILREIGRLREITFRSAGEGTGREADLDTFDAHYQHLFLWHKARGEVAGAYRLVKTADTLATRGVNGLYTSTLFHFHPRFFDRIGPAWELGRSFVRAEYQKQYLPLLLLWKGLLELVHRDGQAPVLFGAVSISREYCTCSRQLIAEFCARHQPEGLKQFVRPRHPLPQPGWKAKPYGSLRELCRDMESVSAAIGDLEPDRKGVPILLKHYWKLGGRVVEFSVDPGFSDCLDGLLVLDLRRTDPQLLRRFSPSWSVHPAVTAE